MPIQNLTKLCAWSLGIILFWSLPGCNPKVFSAPQVQSDRHDDSIIPNLIQADIVYLGERHDSLEAHQAQLEIIVALYQQTPKLAIALEMFQRPYQEVLNRYLAGEIDETQLQQESEYAQRWGYDWEFYAPILRFAKAHNLPVLALNTPSEITRKVAREGLESLTLDEQQHIPPLSEIRTDNEDYRQMIQAVYERHSHGGHGNSLNFERFFTAQVLWDETMAEKVAQFYQANPDYQIIVLAGQGHIMYGYGIPNRVERRLGAGTFTQRSVWLGSLEEEERNGIPAADFVWND